MKALLLILAVALSGLPAFALDDLRQLQATAVIEGYAGRPGRHGEQDVYQMMPGTIRQHGQGSGLAGALAHLRWLKRELAAHGVAVVSFNVSLAWNAGLTAVLEGRAPESSYGYAVLVAGVYDSTILPVVTVSASSPSGTLGQACASDRLNSREHPSALTVWRALLPAPDSRTAAAMHRRQRAPLVEAADAALFVPGLHPPSGGSLPEHNTKPALSGHAGGRPAGAGGFGLQTTVRPAAINCAVTGAVECRTGWPCRDTGRFYSARWVLESVVTNPVVGVGPRRCRPVCALLSL